MCQGYVWVQAWWRSTEAAGDIFLRLALGGIGKDFGGGVDFDEAAEIKEGGTIGASAGLLHVVSDDDDGVLLFQLPDQLFDFGGRDRVERGARLVHQNDLRLDREGARDAKPLLLTSGKSVAADVQPVFDFVPERGGAQASLDGFVDQSALRDSRDPQTVSDIVINRFRERIRFLENHPDTPPEIDDVNAGFVNVDPFDANRAARDPGAFDEIVHPVEATQERGLAATGRTDQRSDRAWRDADAYLVQDLVAPVGKIELLDFDRAAADRRPNRHLNSDVSFRHFENTYHESRLRLRWRNSIDVSAISMTRKRKTKAAPYWTRSVYSFWGIFELTT